MSRGKEDSSTNRHPQTLDQLRKSQADSMLVYLAEGLSVFIKFKIPSPLCALLKPLFIIVILLCFVCNGHFLIPQYIEK